MDKLFNLKLNKFINKSSYLENELEEIELLLLEYNMIFENDFKKEIEFIKKRSGIIPENQSQETFENNTKDIDVVFTNGASPEDIGMSGEKKENNNDDKKNEEENDDNINKEENREKNLEENENKNDLTSIILKKLFHKIVIITHPDKSKIKNNKYIELFIKAKRGYKERNILSLMNICVKLDINIIKCLNEAFKKTGEMNIIKNKLYFILEIQIKGLEDKICFKKKTFVWCWANADTDYKKEIIKKDLYKIWKLPEDFGVV